MSILKLSSAAIAGLLATTSLAAAQTETQPVQGQTPGQPQVAEPCMSDLQRLGEHMNQEGYWLSGYRWGGVGYGVPPAGGLAGTTPAPAVGPDPAMTAQPGSAGDPLVRDGAWGGLDWPGSPHREIRTLYEAALILARSGDQQACQSVVEALADRYGSYVQELQAAGVEPGEVTGWRHEQILAAQPVSEIGGGIRVDDVTDTDLRNPRDEYLGSVEDVIMSSETGQIAYVIVSRGGFLGLGGDEIVVPWEALRATPGLNTFVLDVPEEAFENAPRLERGVFTTSADREQRLAQADQYWEQTLSQ